MPLYRVVTAVAVAALAVVSLGLYDQLAPMDGDYSETETVSYSLVAPVDVEVPAEDSAHVLRTWTAFRVSRFIMPDDPAVRQVADAISERLADGSSDRTTVNKVITWVNYNIDYVSDRDAHGVRDWWQLPYETLRLGTGDCEDMNLLFLSICAALGLDCAYVEEQTHSSAAVLLDDGRRSDTTVSYGDAVYVTADATQGAWAGWSEPDTVYVVSLEDAEKIRWLAMAAEVSMVLALLWVLWRVRA